MPIPSGARLGPYEVVAPLGAGGMGEVYRARDTKLGREVALKILPDAFASEPDRLARFHREAQVLAALNHPNIGAIHGFEEFASANSPTTMVRTLVLELVDGPTLAERIAQGSIPVDEALPIARQIADALDAAHEHGIVHRDLKPANIKVRPDGAVKVLDFGLAKPTAASAGGLAHSPVGHLANSLTITNAGMATSPGIVLGTAAYMSPEQAKGLEVDRTTDVWAFGCVLYEMLAGRPAFAGATTAEVLSEILRSEPDWTGLPRETPASIRRLLRRCLRKDRKDRPQHIDSARLEILDAGNQDTETTTASRRPTSHVLPWAVAALSLLTAGFLIVREVRRPPPATGAVSRVSVSLPDELEISTISAPSAAMSPDGSQLVFTGAGGGARRLYLRRLDQDDAVALAGTETGSQGVFAPDGRSIAFISADRTLKTFSLADGLVAVVTRGVDRSFGATWGSDGMITFVRDRELWQISPGSGEPRRLTTLDTMKGDLFHAWPTGLPGGAVLFNAVTGIGTGAMRIDAVLPATGERRTVVEGGGYPQYAPSGHLMFMREGTLVVAPFDMQRMQVSGPAARLAEDVTRDTIGAPLAFVSASGALVYVSRHAGASRLVWLSRQGLETPLVDRVQAYSTPQISPDGRRIITDISGDMWVLDIERSSFTRLTSKSFASNSYGAWTPDGTRVVFRTALGISVTNADGTGQPELLPDTSVADFANAVTPDGAAVLVTRQTPDRSGDVYLVSLRNEFKPRPIVSTPAYEGGVRLSPDGLWMAYASDESGRFEVYVRPMSGPDRRWLASADGGTNAIWNRTGNELIYRQGNRLMAVRVTATPTLAFSKPATLFEQRFVIGTSVTFANYDMSPDGQRFVVIKNQSNSGRLEVALNWTEELRRLAPP